MKQIIVMTMLLSLLFSFHHGMYTCIKERQRGGDIITKDIICVYWSENKASSRNTSSRTAANTGCFFLEVIFLIFYCMADGKKI